MAIFLGVFVNMCRAIVIIYFIGLLSVYVMSAPQDIRYSIDCREGVTLESPALPGEGDQRSNSVFRPIKLPNPKCGFRRQAIRPGDQSLALQEAVCHVHTRGPGELLPERLDMGRGGRGPGREPMKEAHERLDQGVSHLPDGQEGHPLDRADVCNVQWSCRGNIDVHGR